MYYERELRKSLWQGLAASIVLLALTAWMYTLPTRPDAPEVAKQYWQLMLPTYAGFGLLGLFFFPFLLHRNKRRLDTS